MRRFIDAIATRDVGGRRQFRRGLFADFRSLLGSHRYSCLIRFALPRNAAHTKGGIRGFKPWFDDRQVQIAVTRVVRDDPAKRLYE